MTAAELDRLSYRIIQAAIEIHKALGPGLLESTYLTCMKYEFRARDIGFTSELVVPVRPIHRAQLLSYLRLLDKSLGLLINFNVERLVVGVDRVVNNFGRPTTASIAPAGEASPSPEVQQPKT